MKKAIEHLLKVKTIVTLLLTILFMVMCYKNNISGKDMYNIYLMVIAFYFGTQHSKQV